MRDAKDSLPMMPFYVSDWRGSTSRATLSPMARLAYLELLFASWAEGGSLPDDDRKLAALAGIAFREWERVRDEVVAVLALDDDGTLYHPRVRFELDRSLGLRDKHRRGAAAANARRAAEQHDSARSASAQRPAQRTLSERSATRTAHAQRTPPAPAPAPAPETETEERTPASGDAGGLDVSLSSESGTTTAPEPTNSNGALNKSWSSQAVDAWVGRFGGTAPKAMFTWLKPLVDRHGWEAVKGAWVRYLAEKDPQYANPKDFADKFAAWIDGPKARAQSRTRPGMLDADALMAMAAAAKSREEGGNAA